MALATATIIGLTTSAIGAGMSFKQAAEAKTAAQTAETDAKNLMDEAKKNIEKDYMEELTVPLDAFEAASKENVALQNQSIQAIREGDQRGLQSGAVTQVGQDAAEQRRIAMGQELSDLQKLKIQSKENIRDEIVSMDVAGAADANLRARDAQEARTAAMTNAVSALGQGANAYAEGQDLYKKTTVENPYGGVVDPLQGVQPPATIENRGYGDLQNRGLHTNIENPYYGVGALSLENRGLHRRN
jgi:hypothetical protein|tara:strand:+ start:7295 stop:8026 length:732 start_codon:yes stop_codon:yes gene_type:complete